MLTDLADCFVVENTCQTSQSLEEICIMFSIVNKTAILSAPTIGENDEGKDIPDQTIIKINYQNFRWK